MAGASTALDADWLGACRRAAEAVERMLAERPTTDDRLERTGERGEGGDRTLVIDQLAEDAVFAELRRLHDEGVRFCAVSEEHGVEDFGDPDVLVVIDPIDGSLNAKRGVSGHALSIAVADGGTMADVGFGFVRDLGAGEEWWARRGEGAFLDDRPLDREIGARRDDDGKLEILGIESADPRWVAASIEELGEAAHRLRAVGAIALSLCSVAAARFDAMCSLRRCRAVDAAAAQLIAREAGAHVAFPSDDWEGPLGAPLDLEPRAPVLAARSAAALEEIRAIPSA